MLRFQFETFKKAFGKKDYLIAYSVKANSNVAILKLLGNFKQMRPFEKNVSEPT